MYRLRYKYNANAVYARSAVGNFTLAGVEYLPSINFSFLHFWPKPLNEIDILIRIATNEVYVVIIIVVFIIIITIWRFLACVRCDVRVENAPYIFKYNFLSNMFMYI